MIKPKPALTPPTTSIGRRIRDQSAQSLRDAVSDRTRVTSFASIGVVAPPPTVSDIAEDRRDFAVIELPSVGGHPGRRRHGHRTYTSRTAEHDSKRRMSLMTRIHRS